MPTPLFVQFLLRVLSSWIAKHLPALSLPLYQLRIGRFSRYRRELAVTVRAMPFIYRDLEGEVLSDYVEVAMHTLDLATLTRRGTWQQKQRPTDHLLNNTRVIFLGQAGVGKTTFQRYVILSLLRKADRRFLYPAERIVPIYVPLKAVDNSSPFPVARYVLQNNRLFANHNASRAIQELIRLGNKRRLFLFLDGYDEIAFTGAKSSEANDRRGQNFVQQELASMLLDSRGISSGLGSRIEEASHAMSRGRVWLSSRLEFFAHNPLIGVGGYHLATAGLAAVELLGIGNNRTALARVIFDKYRRRSSEYAGLLSEEYFITTIDASSDDDIRGLSFNPLLRTSSS